MQMRKKVSKEWKVAINELINIPAIQDNKYLVNTDQTESCMCHLFR